MSRLLRALVAIAAIAASVGSGRSAAATTPERRLIVVADSVPLGAAPAIRAAFTGWDVAIEGRQVVVTATAVDPGGPGYLTAYPCGAAPLTAST